MNDPIHDTNNISYTYDIHNHEYEQYQQQQQNHEQTIETEHTAQVEHTEHTPETQIISKELICILTFTCRQHIQHVSNSREVEHTDNDLTGIPDHSLPESILHTILYNFKEIQCICDNNPWLSKYLDLAITQKSNKKKGQLHTPLLYTCFVTICSCSLSAVNTCVCIYMYIFYQMYWC